MKPKRTIARKSAPDTLNDNRKAMQFWADMAGATLPDRLKPLPDKPKVTRKPREPSAKLLEGAVQGQIIDYLRVRPDVVWFARMNSGVMVSEYGGRTGYTAFYKLYIKGIKPRSKGLVDIIGQLTDGTFFVIECKREGVFKATDEQNEYMDVVVGRRGVAQSLQDAIDILDGVSCAGD